MNVIQNSSGKLYHINLLRIYYCAVATKSKYSSGSRTVLRGEENRRGNNKKRRSGHKVLTGE